MRIKYFFVYIGLGAAFLGVSLWVLLSGGKNAKAINAKYRLGGMMLSAWALLSASTCSGGPIEVTCYDTVNTDPPEIMCYDPIIEETTVQLSLKGKTFNDPVEAGDVFEVRILYPTHKKYAFIIRLGDEDKTVLQENILTIPADAEAVFDIPLADTVTYKGEAYVVVLTVEKDDPLTYSDTHVVQVITLK